MVGGLAHTFYISKKVSAKYRLLAGMMGSIVPSLVLLILSGGGRGIAFWRLILPAQVIGAFAMWLVYVPCQGESSAEFDLDTRLSFDAVSSSKSAMCSLSSRYLRNTAELEAPSFRCARRRVSNPIGLDRVSLTNQDVTLHQVS